METDQVAKKARMLGYDGVIFKGVKDSPTAGSFTHMSRLMCLPSSTPTKSNPPTP